MSVAWLSLFVAGCAAAPVVPPPRVAVLYSDYGDYRHRDQYDGVLAELGWPYVKVENTAWADLVRRLDEYDLVLGTPLYNYSHVQDLAADRDTLTRWLDAGGAMILTDVNYPAHVDWLRGLGEKWAVGIAGSGGQEGKPARILDPGHPLLSWPHRWQPRGMWAEMRPGARWQVLATNEQGGALLAAADVGKGYLALYSQWPLDRQQLSNAWEWLRMRRTGAFVRDFAGWDDIHPGPCRAELAVVRTAADATTSVRWVIEQPDGQIAAATATVPAGPALSPLALAVELTQRGRHRVWLELAGGGAEYRSAPTEVDVPERFVARVTSPVYRNLLLLDATARVGCEVTAWPYGEAGGGVTLRATLRAGERAVAEQEVAAPERDGERVALDLPCGAATPGDLELMIEARHEGGVVWRTARKLRALRPGAGQVMLGPALETYVDGEPFFPVGIYHVPVEAFDRVRSMGFNCLQAWGNDAASARAALDAAGARGLKVILEMSGLLRGRYQPDKLTEVVRACRDHPALLAWYPVDEPSGEQLNWCADAYQILQREDPYHPVYLADCNPATFAISALATDILIIDPYPIPHGPVSTVAGWMVAAQEGAAGRRAVWLAPQLFNWAAYRDRPEEGRAPSPDEEWSMVAQGLIYGAKGVIYYPWDDTKCGLVHEPELLEAVPQINALLAAIGREVASAPRTLLVGRGQDAVQPAEEQHAALFSGEKRYLLATNTAPETASLELLLAGERLRSLRDAQTWPIQDGRATLVLAPLQTLVAVVE